MSCQSVPGLSGRLCAYVHYIYVCMYVCVRACVRALVPTEPDPGRDAKTHPEPRSGYSRGAGKKKGVDAVRGPHCKRNKLTHCLRTL
ncbi:hypothetical protein LX32DRAFT_153510 [Colletotrichum zoysiae]|uniref:Uncharacterized protein n=1 Tax=Colletotrichum zoysiae TaxID=1216348 RepID=A0AAD9HWH5_9PEZI|nr:hypothetical protein LX32DRAFT_153510 [Colletotrichum zoysiae]